MIFSNPPNDWEQLESRIWQILTECGCIAERSKRIVLPRGEVQVDVYALDRTREPNLVIVCECKHWNKPVNQNAVHAFRTVISEIGAHVGLMISSKGFQSGAVKAAKNTNVELLTWEQFEERFYERWFEAMQKKLAGVADEVFDYSDYFHRRTTSVLHGIPERVRELQLLWARFSAYTEATSSFSMLFRRHPPKFPIEIVDPRPGIQEIRTIKIADASTYFELLFASARPAIDAYESFIAKYAEKGAASRDADKM